jgi:predicted helicase
MQDKTITALFEQVAELTGYPTSGEKDTTGANFYAREWIKMDYSAIYGGYVINIVQKGTGEAIFDGSTRKSKKEMTAYLRGLIRGLTYSKS